MLIYNYKNKSVIAVVSFYFILTGIIFTHYATFSENYLIYLLNAYSYTKEEFNHI